MRLRALLAAPACLALACAAPQPRERGGELHSAKGAAYRWINPLLDCLGEENARGTRMFQAALQERIARETASGEVSRVALYFRDLRDGPVISIHGEETFLPASLLKLPLLIAVLQEVERAPAVWDEAIPVPPNAPFLQVFEPAASPFLAGERYPVSALAAEMARSSDNAAMAALAQRFGTKGITRLYDELGVITPADGVPDFLGVRDYSAIFRLLYNASYLGRAESERALELLSRADFRDGLVAPLPKGIAVAHKYGERGLENGENQLHDCGIVYFPGHPYILCVMTRGRDWAAQSRAIQDLSRWVYDELRRQFPTAPAR